MIEQQSRHATAFGDLGDHRPMIGAGTADVSAANRVKDDFVFRRSVGNQPFGLPILDAGHTLNRDGHYLDPVWQLHPASACLTLPAEVRY